ncbi:MAG: alanine--tRNA ligase-related protein [bacterium]|nr:alanine--tRNA ligase-related protein [bacterium]
MTSEELRQRFIDFFSAKGHKIVPSSSLLPDDPSVLLTTAGMQQFKKYFTGELDATKDFGSHRVLSIQKCFRTGDIDEVGDATHLTFFEMLGNFSFGPIGSDNPKDFGSEGYFKRSAMHWGYEFIKDELGVAPERISVTFFKGENGVPRDEEAHRIWTEEIGLPADKVIEGNFEDNFWGPTGSEGPCGPTAEIYVDGIEVWNLVFNEYYRHKDGRLEKLANPGVDTGAGFERILATLNGYKSVYETDLFLDIVPDGLPTAMAEKIKRTMLDHSRSSAFLIADGIRPSNKDQGYILRRLLRRMMAHFMQGSSLSDNDILSQDFADIEKILVNVVKKYSDFYPELNQETILSVFQEENNKFRQAIRNGVRELKKIDNLDAKKAFSLFESFGLTFEIIKDFAGEKAKDLKREDFDKEFEKHQEISRAGAEKKFGGHGLILDTGELKAGNEEELNKVLRLHTATHLLHQALRDVLGNSVRQMGSDITPERTRFDFAFDRKLTQEEISQVEKIANEKVAADWPMRFQEMPKEEAEKTGALHFFKAKYPEMVKVYYVGPADKGVAEAYSKEFCGGPHITHTGEIGKIKIVKEEAVAAGVRRIRAIVE